MYDWTAFDTVFEKASKWTYEQHAVHTLSRARQTMDGMLFFDRIWASLGLKQVAKSFPPKSNQELRKLFDMVVNTSAPDHQKHAIIYYILLDCKPITDQGEAFARKVYLPRKYKVLITGLHHLDQGQAKQALELLTDPSLTPTFSDQVLYTLIQNPRVDNSLVIAYYLTVLPPLDDQKTLKAFFSLLCDNNIVHAYHFCQVRVNPDRKALFEQLVLAAISPKGGEAVVRAETLIGLPFNDMETQWFEDILLHGKGSSLLGAKDSVMIRRIATGRDYTDLQSLQRFHGQEIDGVHWGGIRSNLQQGNNI